MTATETQYCYRHPDRETGLSCSDCGRPICADCATFAPVGIRCPDHSGMRRTTRAMNRAPRPVAQTQRRLGATDALVTKVLIGINAVVYLIGVIEPGGGFFYPLSAQAYVDPHSFYQRLWLYAPEVAHGGWYRLLTSAFLHASIWHIGFNMLALWLIGAPVEMYLGRARYLGLYLVSGLAGSAGALIASPLSPTVGASGAIFGILGAMLIIEHRATGSLRGTAMTLIVINLVWGFVFNGFGGNISIGGHIGGLIGGILVTLAYTYWGNRRRIGGVTVDLGAILGLVLVGVGSVVIAYFRVRGYA
jgi:membrane associated rhomboid family serine protease